MKSSEQRPHAEISGAGLVGLTAACALANKGWTVVVHERNSEVRDIGAGLSLWGNGVAAIREIGAAEAALGGADQIDAWRLRDHRGRSLQDEWLPQGEGNAFAVLRPNLHTALRQRAEALGVEIRTDSRVVGAGAEGTLTLAGGEVRTADLVVGADGVHSPVRESLGLTRTKRALNDGGGRHLVERKPGDVRNQIVEHWDGGRRIGIVPCTPDTVYIYLCCPGTDTEAVEQTRSLDAWRRSFPQLVDYIDRIPQTEEWRRFTEVYPHAWSKGRAVIVGDAASAMTPNLGQAACVGMFNAVSLAQSLADHDDVRDALQEWETRERAVTELTQKYSGVYGRLGTRWPRGLQGIRSKLVRRMAQSEQFQRHINQAARRRLTAA